MHLHIKIQNRTQRYVQRLCSTMNQYLEYNNKKLKNMVFSFLENFILYYNREIMLCWTMILYYIEWQSGTIHQQIRLAYIRYFYKRKNCNSFLDFCNKKYLLLKWLFKERNWKFLFNFNLLFFFILYRNEYEFSSFYVYRIWLISFL